MRLVTDKFTLRSWQSGDEESLVQQADNYKIWINLRDSFPHPYTRQDAQNWIVLANTMPNSLNLAIVIDGVAVGGAGLLFKEDVYRRSAEIGYWLGEKYWNQGIVTEAVKKLSEHAFRNYDICRLFAGIFEYNKPSMRVLEKAGFSFEGIHRKAIIKNGQVCDEYVYALVH